MNFTVLPGDPAWLTKAADEVGFHEIGDNRGIDKYITLAKTGRSGDPWCAIFANAMLEASGIRGTRSPAAISFAQSANFIRIAEPKRGAICVFTRTGGNHVGFYVGKDAQGRLLILGGNQSNQVCVEPHAIDSTLIGYFWPANDSAQPDVADGDLPQIEVGATGAAVVLLQQLLGIPQSGIFDAATDIAVRSFQLAHGLEVDGQVWDLTWAMLTGKPSAALQLPVTVWSSGKGSWYSQFPKSAGSRYGWSDSGDAAGSNALEVPDYAQGISFYNHATLGHWFEVIAPNGVHSIEIQSEIGPAPWTGRLIDVSAVCAERCGYAPDNFPTDKVWKWRRIDPPAAVAALTPKQQAVQFFQIRKGSTMDPTAQQPPTGQPAQPTQPQLPPPMGGATIDLAAVVNSIKQGKGYAKDAILAQVAIYNAMNPTDKIILAGDAPAQSAQGTKTTAPPVSTAPAASTPATALQTLLAPLGGGSGVTFWSGLAGLVANVVLAQAGIVGPPTGAGATTVGALLPTLAGSATMAGIFGKLGSIGKVLAGIAAVIPK